MILVIIFDLEERFANFAVVRPVGVVHAEHVLLEVRQLSKGFLTQLADVRLLTGVHPQVKLERRGVRKRPEKYLTLRCSVSWLKILLLVI